MPVIGVTKLTPENIQKLLTRKGKVATPLSRWIKANPELAAPPPLTGAAAVAAAAAAAATAAAPVST